MRPRPKRVTAPSPRPRLDGSGARRQSPDTRARRNGSRSSDAPRRRRRRRRGLPRQARGSRPPSVWGRRRREPQRTVDWASNAEPRRQTAMAGSWYCTAMRLVHRHGRGRSAHLRRAEFRRSTMAAASIVCLSTTRSQLATAPGCALAAAAHDTSPRTAGDRQCQPPPEGRRTTASSAPVGADPPRPRGRPPKGRSRRLTARARGSLTTPARIPALSSLMEYHQATRRSGRGRPNATSRGATPSTAPKHRCSWQSWRNPAAIQDTTPLQRCC